MRQKIVAATPGPVAPAVPILPIGQQAPAPKSKAKDVPFVEEKSAKKEFVDAHADVTLNKSTNKPEDVTFGSPVSMAAHAKTERDVPNKADIIISQDNGSKASEIANDIVKSGKAEGLLGTVLPTGRETAIVTDATPLSPELSSGKEHTPVPDTSIVATPPAISRPSTPITVASKTSDTSAIRPRTLRLTTTMSQKPDTAPASAATEKSSSLPSGLAKQRSRQPSVSSISRSRPSTPAISDLVFSYDVSRANSPPPSIIGSAPERTKTKNQIRKERKSKVRESAEAPSEEPAMPVERKVEEVAPIVSRQKKKKRTQDRSTPDDTTSSAIPTGKFETRKSAPSELADSGVHQNSRDTTTTSKDNDKSRTSTAVMPPESEPKSKPQVPVAKKEEKVPTNVAAKDPYTLNQLYIDAGKANDPEAFQQLLDENTSSVQVLLSQLFESKELDQSSALFNIPPLSSYRLPPDSRKGADYLSGNSYTMSNPFGEIYVTSKERKALQQGSAVRISDPNKPADLLKRTMITSQGRVYRHLSQEEEDRVLELERTQDEDEQIFGELGMVLASKVDEEDFPNIEGGLEDLLRYGERHGVSWIMDEKDSGAEGMDDDDDDADWPSEDDEAGELASLGGGWQAAAGAAPAAADSKDHAGVRHENQKNLPNLRAMDIEKLQRTIRETQAEVDQARREMEAMEKKWVKKGKEAAKWRESTLKAVAGGSD